MNVNDKAYILANNMYVREVYIANISGDYVTVRIGDGAIQLKIDRVFATREAAEKQDPNTEPPVYSDWRETRENSVGLLNLCPWTGLLEHTTMFRLLQGV